MRGKIRENKKTADMVEDIKLFMSRDPGAQQFKAQYDEMMNKNEEEVSSMVTQVLAPLFERNMTADKLVRIGEERGIKKGEERGFKIGEERGIKKGEERGFKIGEERGFKIGEERGFKIGEERGAVKMLLSLEYTENEISARTGLPIERVRSIAKELGGSAS
jgi:hypothetical protein